MIGASYSQASGASPDDIFWMQIFPSTFNTTASNGTIDRSFNASVFNGSGSYAYSWSSSFEERVEFSSKTVKTPLVTFSGYNETIGLSLYCTVTDTVTTNVVQAESEITIKFE